MKYHVAKAMIEDAEARGVLTKDKTIIKTTSCNTGIALAANAAAKGYKLRIHMQDSVTEERTKVVKLNRGCTIFRCSRNGNCL
ncbi:pyridoxal-phosphate dependent enzyme [Lysinibacillus sp. Ag94]|uniref:pyridoxal-phosphate dependent enzyme n=1 Tax=Lysinibacillus sp. Ag94 TaxID=2936682 RepID=UPI003530C366